jgi:molecular chaperone DnaK
MELRSALDGDDLADIRAKTDALQEASHKLAEAVYAQATAAQSTAHDGGNGAEPSDDEVIEDAEVVDEEAPTS